MAFSIDFALLLSVLTFLLLSNSNVFVTVEASHYVVQNLRYNSSEIRHNESRQPYRTAYHFQPQKNWINDPNGPMIYKGIYHLFYQYNPKGPFFGNYIVWGHSTSTDLVNWTPQVPALEPSIPSDIGSCWSGSATILPGNKPAILYTGVTLHQSQSQNLAFPKTLDDPYLKEWVKYPKNPIIAPTPTDEVNASAFRDPSTAWTPPDGEWRLVIGTKIGGRALAALYRSTDFVHWAKVKHPLYDERDVGMWECVDFYPVAKDGAFGVDTSIVGSSVKHVFKVSRDESRHDIYVIGRYDYRRDLFVPDDDDRSLIAGDSGFRYNYGVFYASKTFYDAAKRRRILWGWVYETSSLNENLKKGWAGIQAIPRTILLDKGGKQLVQWPIEEIEKLREKEVNLPNKVIKGGSTIRVIGINSSQADVKMTFKVRVREVELEKVEELDTKWMSDPKQLCNPNFHHYKKRIGRGGVEIGPFGVLTLATQNLQEYTAVSFRIFKNHAHKLLVLMCSDQSRSSFHSNPDDDKENKYYGTFVNVDPLHEELSLRTLIDHSVVESFGAQGRSCITARVYPRLAVHNNAHLYIFNNGTQSVIITSFRAWSIKKARVN